MEKSTHKCEVVSLNFTKHPNADSLSMTDVWGYLYIGNTKQWEGVKLGVFIPPDSLVDTTMPEFADLAGEARYAADSTRGGVYYRVRAKKLRGIVSYGYMVPAPEGANVGDDFADYLKVLHYEAPLRGSGGNKERDSWYMGGEVEAAPEVYTVKYDVDALQAYVRVDEATQKKFHLLFTEGEPVHASEKIHGANGRWVFHNGKMYCGSRTEWKRQYAHIPEPQLGDIVNKLGERLRQKKGVDFLTDDEIVTLNVSANTIIENIRKKNANPPMNLWWKALEQHPELRRWCEEHPDIVVYGEVYGAVQDLQYGVPQGQVRIAVFDILNGGNWMDVHAARLASPELPWVPVVVDNYPFNLDELVAMAEGNSLVPGAEHQIREGIVVKPVNERYDARHGRVNFKIVSPTYLERSK